ncbi:MAG TPA: hypothetical protein VHG72_14885 [Polyangia bacterium]|nr:hypothetical protein [Polyangia bacterium]
MKTSDQIEEAVCEAGARLKPRLQDAQRRLASWNRTAIKYIGENPGRCLLGAVAVGFVFGKIARRT